MSAPGVVRIGINPITWTNDDMPELGGDIPLDTCLAETKLAGYAGTEMGGKFPRTASELEPLLAGHGLDLVSGWFDGRLYEREVEAEWEAVLPHLTLLRDMGCRHVVYADLSGGRHGDVHRALSARPVLAAGEWAGYGRKVTQLAEQMADFGVGMAFHHHMGTIVQSDAEVDALMAHSGAAVGLLFDSGHGRFAGGDPAALLARHVGRVVHVHCKDVRAAVLGEAIAGDWSFMAAVLEGVFTVPGDGCIDFGGLLGQLRRAGYGGWLVVEAEQDSRLAHPLTYARMGFESLRASAVEAGWAV